MATGAHAGGRATFSDCKAASTESVTSLASFLTPLRHGSPSTCTVADLGVKEAIDFRKRAIQMHSYSAQIPYIDSRVPIIPYICLLDSNFSESFEE